MHVCESLCITNMDPRKKSCCIETFYEDANKQSRSAPPCIPTNLSRPICSVSSGVAGSSNYCCTHSQLNIEIHDCNISLLEHWTIQSRVFTFQWYHKQCNKQCTVRWAAGMNVKLYISHTSTIVLMLKVTLLTKSNHSN